MQELFLDANAHLPTHPVTLKAYADFCQSPAGHGHPSSPSRAGRLAAVALEIARAQIANLIGATNPSQIIFTGGCTEACRWGLDIFHQIPTQPKLSSAVSQLEHPAVSQVLDQYLIANPGSFEFLSVSNDGTIIFRQDESFHPFKYDKICCIHLQNEAGVITDLANISCNYLFSDMSQSLGKIPVNVTELDVDVAVFGAHKFGGIGNFGFIYLKDSSQWQSYGTGSRYFLDRPGTPDVAGAVASAVALAQAIETLPLRTQHMLAFQATLEAQLNRWGLEIIGQGATRSPNTTFLAVPGMGLSILMTLSEQGIHLGLGSACGSLHTGPSRLMTVLNRSEQAHDFLRISQFGEYGEKEATYLLHKLDQVLVRQ